MIRLKDNKKPAKKELVLKKWVVVFLTIVIIMAVIANVILLLNSIKIGKKDTRQIDYVYQIKQKMDYKVLLYPNSFIEKEYLGKGETYLSDLVKTINVTYNYQYNSSKKINLHYDYKIEAIVTGEYYLANDDTASKVWTKKYLISSKNGDVEDAYALNLNPSAEIDYNFYNDVVSEFRKELKLSINANLSVLLTTHVTGKIDNNKIDDTKTMEIKLPLNQLAFKITENLSESDSKQFMKEEIYVKDINYRRLITGVIAQISIIILVINYFRLILDIKPKSYYEKKKRKYLKEYGDIIVEINNQILDDNFSVIEVKSFNELVDLEEESHIPINFYQFHGEEKGEFLIIHNNILYKYILVGKHKK